MRVLLPLVLAGCIAAGLAVIYLDAQKPPVDVMTSTGVPPRVNMIDEEKLRADLSGVPAAVDEGVPVDPGCVIWGPFSTQALRRIELVLERARLLEKMQIADRFLPERYIVYLGPYVNEVAVRAFVKQFRQQGFKSVRPIVRGDLAYGVEIRAFKTREEAEAYLASGKAPEVQGLRVTNRLGEPSNDVDLVFRRLTSEERERLIAAWRARPSTTLRSCSELGF